jgi:hypothetical protein
LEFCSTEVILGDFNLCTMNMYSYIPTRYMCNFFTSSTQLLLSAILHHLMCLATTMELLHSLYKLLSHSNSPSTESQLHSPNPINSSSIGSDITYGIAISTFTTQIMQLCDFTAIIPSRLQILTGRRCPIPL